MNTIQWRTRRLLAVAALGVVIATLSPDLFSRSYAQAVTPAARPAALAPQTSNAGNVIVTVIPRNVSADAASWYFDITFSSHSQAVEQDITKTVVLIDAAGQPHAPIAWVGDPPGGHHRKGLLRFEPLADNPTVVELRVQGIGGVAVRTFRWRLE